jgi:hypothetical protein
MSSNEELRARQARAARNESRFRELNERVEELHTSAAFTEYFCECTRADCGERVSLTIVEYEEVRKVPTHFIIARGHIVPQVERIVRETPRYQVVEKVGVAGEVAARLDPRASRSDQ